MLDFETVFRALDIPTVILDAEGSVVVWNEALEGLLGIDRSEIEGLDSIGEYVYDGEREAILAEKVLAHPHNADEIYDIERADSEYALLSLPDQPTYEDTSTILGGSGADVWFLAVPLYRDGELVGVFEFVQQRSDSERQRREMEQLLDELAETLTAFQEGNLAARAEYDFAESILDPEDVEVIDQVNELARMREALREQVRATIETKRKLERQNDQLEEFTGVVSHDLRNPLEVATGRLELAREECDSEHLEGVARAHDRMESLIDDLLTVAKQGNEVTDPDLVDLGEIVEKCWRTVQTDSATLHLDASQTINADENRLRQLFENLIRNAVEHAGPDVEITVGDLNGGLYVADDGPGIPKRERDSVFESGYSTADGGTGFGLSIVKAVADAHGWDVSVTDSATGGARFEIREHDPAGLD
jgi:signal transduction histidine kinase